MKNPYDWIEHSLDVIERAQWTRSVKAIAATQSGGSEILIDGKQLINFASNDYLGLATHPAVKAAAIAAIETYGTGSTGSRLLSGQRPPHQALEEAIADWKQTEAALVFSSGYLANLSTLQAVVGPRDLILADEYNHSSLKNGAKLSGAQVLEFKHASVSSLAIQLQTHRPQYRRCMIATDGVFSMDGDCCPLPPILDLATKHEAMVLVDDAHATGVMGCTGSGTLEHFGQRGRPVIQVGTLSKALGSLGGYVAGNQSLINFLKNRGAGWIYTTGLSPADCAAASQSIRQCRTQPEHLQALRQNIADVMHQLGCVLDGAHPAIKLLPSDSAIACIEVDTPQTVLQLSKILMDHGCFVPAIRPPTVPTSRLRISLMASHTPAQIQALIRGLSTAIKSR